MFYSDTVGILFVMLTAATIIGWKFAELLPWKLRAESRLFLSPLIGLAVLLHLIILLGWVGHGYRQPVCLLVIGLPVLASLWGRRDLTPLIKNIALIVSFSVVATAGVLSPVWRYAVMNPYNDTFAYWVHGQWLQSHGFAQRAIVSGSHPAATQVAFYQGAGLRMGASFMLGYVQGLMRAAWSYQVYAAVVAIPVVLCALAVAATAYAVCRRLVLSLLCGATVGLTLNGFTFGASNGFLPQTWGLAFVAGSLVLAGSILRHLAEHSKTNIRFKHWIPVALLLSAATHCYSEILPLLIVTLGLVFLMAAMCLRRGLRGLLIVAGWLGFLSALLVNLEWLRIARALRSQASAVVGGPVDWPWWHFLWHAMGLRTGPWDNTTLFLLGANATRIACVVGIAFVVAGLCWSGRGRGRIWCLMPHLVFLSLATAAFVYFRLVAASPWPTGTGQSWNQLKLSNWATPSMFCLLAAGLAAISRRNLITSFIVSMGLLGILAMGIMRSDELADVRTHYLRSEAGIPYDPLSVFAKISRLSASIPEEVPIYLSVDEHYIKLRQMLLYVLQDHALAGDWSADDNLFWLRNDQRNQTTEPCRWIISTDLAAPPTARRAGNLWLGPCPGTLFMLQSSTGGYDREQDQTGWWYWTARQLHFLYRIQGEQPSRVVVSFTYVAVSDHRPIRLSVDGKTLDLFFEAGWHDWTSPPIELEHMDDTIEVGFDCDLPPVRLSEHDSRQASYLIKNFVLRRVD